MPKGGYLLPWTNVYQKYIAFSNARTPNHPCHTLTKAIDGQKGNLDRDLGYLESYYAELRNFLNLAATAKASPNSMINPTTTVQQELLATEAKLCSQDTLWPYFYGYKGGLQTLASIAEDIQAWIAKVKGQTSFAGAPLGKEVVTALLNEVGSISNKVKADWQDEVKGSGSLDAFNAYYRARPQTLLALRAVGGTENMPPLPPSPAT